MGEAALSLDGLPQELRRFKELMRTCPLCAVVNQERAMLRAVQLAADNRRLVLNFRWEMKNWGLMCEALDLFWVDPVWSWVESHPCAANGLHYRNMASDRPAPLPVVDLPWPSQYETGESCDFLGLFAD
jgi:hypothetical protein